MVAIDIIQVRQVQTSPAQELSQQPNGVTSVTSNTGGEALTTSLPAGTPAATQATSTPQTTASPDGDSSDLSSGQIGGIIGALIALGIFAGVLIYLCCACSRRRRERRYAAESALNKSQSPSELSAVAVPMNNLQHPSSTLPAAEQQQPASHLQAAGLPVPGARRSQPRTTRTQADDFGDIPPTYEQSQVHSQQHFSPTAALPLQMTGSSNNNATIYSASTFQVSSHPTGTSSQGLPNSPQLAHLEPHHFDIAPMTQVQLEAEAQAELNREHDAAIMPGDGHAGIRAPAAALASPGHRRAGNLSTASSASSYGDEVGELQSREALAHGPAASDLGVPSPISYEFGTVGSTFSNRASSGVFPL